MTESIQPPQITPFEERISPGRFDDRTVIVTGAGSGIGAATASRILREGGRVVAVDVSEERLADFAAGQSEDRLILVSADITDVDALHQVVAAAGDRIDGLANVAGIMDDMTPVHEVTDEVWRRVMAINVDGTMRLMRAVLPIMLAQRSGSIVNVASEAALRGSAAGAAYTVSKHAVVGLTRNSAHMYATSGVRVNAVAPGPVATNIEARFASSLGAERIGGFMRMIPAPTVPSALAAPISFLLSDDAANINGAILPSDGGWSAQ
ncbi:MAG TPA: SDR family NAD(P)-dependent oxidoreductase [Microlunatus sp.]